MELNVYFQPVGDLSFNKDTIGSSIDVYSENNLELRQKLLQLRQGYRYCVILR